MYTPAIVVLKDVAKNKDHFETMETVLLQAKSRNELLGILKGSFTAPQYINMEKGDMVLAAICVCRKKGWSETNLPGKEYL